MKHLLLSCLLFGLAACTSTADVADSSTDATTPACCAEMGAEGCAEKMADCEASKAECSAEAKVCPVTGKTIN